MNLRELKRWDDGLIGKVKAYWPLIVALFFAIATYVRAESTIAEMNEKWIPAIIKHDSEIQLLKLKIEDQTAMLYEIRQDVKKMYSRN